MLGAMPSTIPALPVMQSGGSLHPRATCSNPPLHPLHCHRPPTSHGQHGCSTPSHRSATADSSSSLGESVSGAGDSPTISKTLLNKIRRWEYVDLAELLAATLTTQQHPPRPQAFPFSQVVRWFTPKNGRSQVSTRKSVCGVGSGGSSTKSAQVARGCVCKV